MSVMAFRPQPCEPAPCNSRTWRGGAPVSGVEDGRWPPTTVGRLLPAYVFAPAGVRRGPNTALASTTAPGQLA